MKIFKKFTYLFITLVLLLTTFSTPTLAVEIKESELRPAPSFSSGGVDETHQFIVNQGLIIINNDKGTNVSRYFEKYKATLLEYTDKPDIDEVSPLFAYHFYNPYTNKNFLGGSTTAKTKFLEHTKNAKANYASNKLQAMEELGRACHYLSDMNVPHHAANLTAVFSNHSQYESWVNVHKTDYIINSYNNYESIKAPTFSDFCEKLAYNSATNAYSQKDFATSNDPAKWDSSARINLKNAQESVAQYLYKFLIEVGEIK